MIKKIQYYIGSGYDPYYNLALEEYFLDNIKSDTCLFYLWQNQNTVVIGRNQNAWRECQVEKLEANGGYLARRPSGGGAVFHDLGNLNFTFLMNKENYDLNKQLAVILQALQSLGIDAKQSGRNDLTYEGAKFSGNAFYNKGDNVYHHGTLLVDVNIKQLSNYLNVDPMKLQSKGIESVRSRVINLKEICPSLTIRVLQQSLLEAFGQVYGYEPQKLDIAKLDQKKIELYYQKYSSWDWRLGKKIEFSYRVSQRFTWGSLEIQLKIDKGIIIQVGVYSDAMEQSLIGQIAELFLGLPFVSNDLVQALDGLLQQKKLSGRENFSQSFEENKEQEIITDIQTLLTKPGFI